MAIKKVKALHVRGQNARPFSLYVMTGVSRYDSSADTYEKNTPSIANETMASITSNAYPNGIEFGLSMASSPKGSAVFSRFYANHYRGINVTEFAVDDKIVFENGSYILIKYRWDRDDPNDPEGGRNTMVLNYYTVDNELVYEGDYTVEIFYTSRTQGDEGRYYVDSDLVPWKTELYNNRYYLYVGEVAGTYVSSLGVYVPQYRCSCTSSKEPRNAPLSIKFFDGINEYDPDDPYPDDDSGGGDEPDPDGIPEPDDIPIPPLPDVDITDTGFITLYRPSLSQVKRLADYMWSDAFSLASFKKLFADPMDCILGFNVLPVAVPAGEISPVTVGNISTGVNMTECASQWVAFDCGTVNIGTPYDTYLDYSPYTKYSIYLPYIGLQSLSADDVVGQPIHLVYHIDALSCSCVAYLLCGSSVLYQFAGSCGYSIPLTGDSFRGMISSMINIATTVAGAVATGGMTAPLAISTGASVASNVMNAKPEVRRSGSVGSSAGLMGVQTPYLILEIPRICKPRDQQRYLGYPSFITDYVGNVGGYSEWESVILSGVPCTDEERASIEEILKGGVYNV